MFFWGNNHYHDDHDNSPAKEEKNEAEAKYDAREKKEGEKNR